LADGVLRLLRDEGLRQRLGDAGKAFVLENFAQEQQVRETEDLYFKVLAEKTGRVVKRDAEQTDPVVAGETAAVLTT